MSKSRLIIINLVSVILMAIGSFSLMLSLVVDFKADGIKSLLSYIAAAVFWVSIVVGWILQVASYLFVKKNINFRCLPGIIKFFSNKLALIADVAMFAAFIVCIICLLCNVAVWLQLLFISLFVFAFQMHIVMNSKNFKYIYSLKTN
ncbi:MAG: hypothetical protein NC397_08435 [Clostridium sp.]|nr:hypothetical protein [Clostridium sp.]